MPLFRNAPPLYWPVPDEKLVEVLDGSCRPVCLVAYDVIIEQKLKHIHVAAQAYSASGHFLLRSVGEELFDVTTQSILHHGFEAGEVAEAALAQLLKYRSRVRMIGKMEAHPDYPDSLIYYFAVRCSLPMLKAMSAPPFMIAEPQEMAYLQRLNMFSPMLDALFTLLERNSNKH